MSPATVGPGGTGWSGSERERLSVSANKDRKKRNYCVLSRLQPDLVRNAEDAHFGVLHFQDGVFDHELAAQVAVIGRTHGIHLLNETGKAVRAETRVCVCVGGCCMHSLHLLSAFENAPASLFHIPKDLAPSSGVSPSANTLERAAERRVI